MSGAHLTFQINPVGCSIAVLMTAALAYLLGRRLEMWPAVLLAGFSVPGIVLALGAYHALNAPDDVSRRLIFFGTLAAAALASPVALIVSRLAVGLAQR